MRKHPLPKFIGEDDAPFSRPMRPYNCKAMGGCGPGTHRVPEKSCAIDLKRDWGKNDYNWFWDQHRVWPGLPQRLRDDLELHMKVQSKVDELKRKEFNSGIKQFINVSAIVDTVLKEMGPKRPQRSPPPPPPPPPKPHQQSPPTNPLVPVATPPVRREQQLDSASQQVDGSPTEEKEESDAPLVPKARRRRRRKGFLKALTGSSVS
jgi:hypothetical protein